VATGEQNEGLVVGREEQVETDGARVGHHLVVEGGLVVGVVDAATGERLLGMILLSVFLLQTLAHFDEQLVD